MTELLPEFASIAVRGVFDGELVAFGNVCARVPLLGLQSSSSGFREMRNVSGSARRLPHEPSSHLT
jgi:hypothetical protein